MVKSACSVGDPGSIPGLGRSPGEGNGSPLQYCNLENPMDRVVWQATVHGVTKSWTWLSDFTILLIYSLSVIVFLDFLCYFQFFLESTVRAVLYPVEGKGSILYQAPGWGWVCCTECSALCAACSRVCAAVCCSHHCWALCWESCPRARGRSTSTGGSHMSHSSPGCFQELWRVTFYLGRNMKKNNMKK